MSEPVPLNKFEMFKKAWEDYPSQDNEGYLPDRAGFKCGFFAAWDLLEQRTSIAESDASIKHKYRADVLERRLETVLKKNTDMTAALMAVEEYFYLGKEATGGCVSCDCSVSHAPDCVVKLVKDTLKKHIV